MAIHEILERARQVLAVRRQIIAEHIRHRNQTALEFFQTRESISRYQLASAQHRLGIIETLARAKQLMEPRRVDPVRRIADRNREVLADLRAKGNARREVESQFRAQAKQAALDRAVFIDNMKRYIPEELWSETIDEYDRRLYESREEDAP